MFRIMGVLFASALLALLDSRPAPAAEGMWTFDNLPLSALERDYGFRPDAAWTGKAMRASLRLAGGCSGSFVSGQGLVLTNHHCVRACVQDLSSATRNYTQEGFLARSREQEIKCPQIELNRLEQITDVTDTVKSATAGKGGKEFTAALKAVRAQLSTACVGKQRDQQRCDVVELYAGGRYALYRYHRFQDVRLVFAPEEAIAFFGGDPDNFNFPRYDLDMGVLRAYEGGQPAAIKDYFRFSAAGAAEGEPTFILGNPGSTQRQLTVAQLERLRDTGLPRVLMRYEEIRGLLTQYGAGGGEAARVSTTDLFSTENSFKAYYGRWQALLDPLVFQHKRDEEAALRNYAQQHAELKDTLGAWDAIASAEQTYRDLEIRYAYLEGGRGLWSSYFNIARMLVRGAAERSKPDAQRLSEYTEAALPTLTQALFSPAPITPDYERVKLGFSLTKLREWLGVDDGLVRSVLGQEAPTEMAARLVAATKLGDLNVRHRLWEGGSAAIEASDDPFIQLARLVDGDSRAVRQRYEDEVDAVEKRGAEQIARVRFAMLGTSVYPDATFSPRLSFGKVAGWSSADGQVAPFTDFAGAFARATGQEPFALPKSWLDARDRLNLAQPLDFVTTNDIIGGNSGSPVINRNLEIVGLVFDGNIHSLGGAYYYDEKLNRAVSVHNGAILEALQKIYGASELVKELRGG
ncbi:MAG: S46 family peptidase [Steroidobacteraceae bacterium]